MAKAEKVFEFLGSRNLNTNPIDITGLQGDTYDYTLVAFFEVEGVSSALQMKVNNDATSNYRTYFMLGQVSTANAFTSDTQSIASLNSQSFDQSGFSVMSITGQSGSERLIKGLTASTVSSGTTKVQNQVNYWKNTIDPISSIQLSKNLSVTSNCHIILYRVPKITSQMHYEKIGELNWSSESTEKSFTGLDGDQDEQYRLVWDGDSGLNIEINNDNTAIYTRQFLRNSSAAISAANSTTNTSIVLDGEQSSVIINALTGANRLTTITTNTNSSPQQEERACWYRETITNITTLDCTPSASATGKATLYRKISKNRSGTLPWELVQSVDISGDFSAGHTFSGLQGDSTTLYRLEFVGVMNASNYLDFQINGDTSSNYTYQNLQAVISSVVADTATHTYGSVSQLSTGAVASSNVYIYPKSGSSRPVLSVNQCRENRIHHVANWWGNTLDEISDLKIFGRTSDIITGTLKLWRLK